jgi:hypothetical protein
MINFFGQFYLQIPKALHFYVVKEADIKTRLCSLLDANVVRVCISERLTNHNMKACVKKRHTLVQNRTASVLEQFQLTENAADKMWSVKMRNANIYHYGKCYFWTIVSFPRRMEARVCISLYLHFALSGGPQWCKKEQKMTERLAWKEEERMATW